MDKKEISIILRARNAMAAGIASAGAALKSFGQSAMRIGKAFATAFIGAGAAIGAFAGKALSAYAVQEKAVKALTGALDAYGEVSAGLVPKLVEVAAAIQDETGVSDESTIAGMAKIKMLGVQTERLGEAARAVIALKSVGLEEAAAQKAVAMAMQGNYDMLNRYVPALRNATSEAEKAQIVNDLFARGYEQQKDLLNTTAGSWEALKGRIGDAWEEVGRAIEQNGLLTGAIQKVSDKVKELTVRFAEFTASGGMVNVVAGVKMFGAEAAYNFEMAGLRARVMWDSIRDGAETVGNYIGQVIGTSIAGIIAQFNYLKDLSGEVWKKITNPGSDFNAPSTDGLSAATSEYLNAIAGKGAVTTERFDKTMAAMSALEEKHAADVAKMEADHLAAIEADAAARKEAAEKLAEAEKLAAEQAAQDKIDAAKEAADRAAAEAKKTAAAAASASDSIIASEQKVVEARKRNATLAERSNKKMADLLSGRLAYNNDDSWRTPSQLLAGTERRQLEMISKSTGHFSNEAIEASRDILKGATKTASGFRSTAERKAEEAARSADDRSIGANVRIIAEKIEESLKPA
jgi:hypothetical protein